MFKAVRQKQKAKKLSSIAKENRNSLNRNMILLEWHLILFGAVASLKGFRIRKSRRAPFLLLLENLNIDLK